MATQPKIAVKVRDSQDADLPGIHAIYAHHVLHGLASFEEVAPSLDEMGARRREMLAKGLPYVVAEAGDAVLGYAYANHYRPRSAYRFTLEDSVYIAHDAIGHGIGRELLAHILERSTVLGYRQMIAIIANRLVAEGRDVVHLEVGQPGATAPCPAIRAAHAKLDTDRLGYTDSVGIPAPREAIAALYRERYASTIDAGCVVVTTGSSAGFLLAFLCAFSPGDRIGVPNRQLLVVCPEGANPQ